MWISRGAASVTCPGRSCAVTGRGRSRPSASPGRRCRRAGSTALPAAADPRAATPHTVLALVWTPGVLFIADLVVVFGVPVGAPLPDIAVHVVEPEGVGPVRARLAGPLEVVPLVRSAVGI